MPSLRCARRQSLAIARRLGRQRACRTAPRDCGRRHLHHQYRCPSRQPVASAAATVVLPTPPFPVTNRSRCTAHRRVPGSAVQAAQRGGGETARVNAGCVHCEPMRRTVGGRTMPKATQQGGAPGRGRSAPGECPAGCCACIERWSRLRGRNVERFRRLCGTCIEDVLLQRVRRRTGGGGHAGVGGRTSGERRRRIRLAGV